MHRDQEIVLFEFGDEQHFNGDIKGLKEYLVEVWANRNRFYSYTSLGGDEEGRSSTKQGFLKFDGSQISARNYSGFIFYDGKLITIYPKLFKDIPLNKNKFHYHFLYWLSYCSRLRFPFSEVKFNSYDFEDLIEVFVFIFAGYLKELYSYQVYHCYEEVEDNLHYFKGRLSLNNHINTNLTTGNWQKFYCSYDLYDFNNTFNQIIKYTTRKLLSITHNPINSQNLEQILFVLNDVEDKYCTYSDCDKVKLNNLQSDWSHVLNMSRMFLSNQSVGNNYQDSNNFCFLVPMEYVFEDFIYGFISKHFPSSGAKYHSGGTFLTDQGVFKIEPDIVCKMPEIIIDTKYKIRYDIGDGKKGISQADLYQMISYGIKKKIKDIYLFYPSIKGQSKLKPLPDFTVSSDLFRSTQLNISYFDICVYSDEPKELDNNIKNELSLILEKESMEST